jgi:hypothetical protein
MDHPDRIPKLGRFHLIVDLLVGMTRLTKALMDGGCGINLIYLDTFEGLGLPMTSSKVAHTRSTEWSRANNPSLLGESPYWSPSETQAITALRRLDSR